MIIGIDPGKNGGVASVSDAGTIKVSYCPDTPAEMADIIDKIKLYTTIEKENIFATIELVHAFPTDARSSAFKFGTNYGLWLGILESFRIPNELEKMN